jgi:hypothetical protein
VRPYLKKKTHHKKEGEVDGGAQGLGLGFKPQYCKKNNKKGVKQVCCRSYYDLVKTE